ncbi:MAG: prepilin peptidase [Xanthomonadaceae bacterium]|nr:prepilin peptidase [Xanthomonadaceae bacterium]
MFARRDGSPWAQYRRMRLAWWALTFACIASFLFDVIAIRLCMAVLWTVCSVAAAHWSCPQCGNQVGVVGKGPFSLWIPFGGWCTHCGTRLFLRLYTKAR